MLSYYLNLAKEAGVVKRETESEFSFRKRAFVAMFPNNEGEAIELLFGVTSLSKLNPIHLAMYMGLCGQTDPAVLKKFADAFRDNDPASEYRK